VEDSVVVGTTMKMKKSLSAGTVEDVAGVFVGGGGDAAAAAAAAAADVGADVGAGADAGADAGAGAGWDEQLLYTWPAKGDVQTPEISGGLMISLAYFLSDIFSRKSAELWAFSIRFSVVGRCRGW
jgi:hypothetical protein